MRRLARLAAFALATSDRVEAAVLGIPPLRRAAQHQARRYVAGPDLDAAIAAVRDLEAHGIKASVDLFGENLDDPARIDAEVDRYLQLASALSQHPDAYLSLDCSHFGLDRDAAACQARVERIAQALAPGAMLQLGAEENARADATFALALAAAQRRLPMMVTIQANLYRSRGDAERMTEAGIPVRLVKGAYVEREDVAHPWGPDTDRAFVQLAHRLRELGAEPALATHDPRLLAELLEPGRPGAVEFLLGVRPDEAERLQAAGHSVRVYVPFGQRWFRYYARRVAESIGA